MSRHRLVLFIVLLGLYSASFAALGQAPTSSQDNRSGSSPSTTQPLAQWHVEYYNGETCWWEAPNCSDPHPRHTEGFTGFISKNWGTGSPPNVNNDHWVGRFTATINFAPDYYVFHGRHDDGCAIYISNDGTFDNEDEIFGKTERYSDHYTCPPRYLSGTHYFLVVFLDKEDDAFLYVDWSNDVSPCPTPGVTPTPTSCPAPPIEDISFNPPSPASVGTTVQIHCKATWDPTFRAMRLKIDGNIVYELGAPEWAYEWQTGGYSPGSHVILLEVAALGDNNWSNPTRRQETFTLTLVQAFLPFVTR